MKISRISAAVCLLGGLAAVSGQTAPGSLTGTISYPDGSPVPNAPVQLKSGISGGLVRTVSKQDGRYAFNNLPAGTYEFTLVMPCCAYARVANEIVIEPGKAVVRNIGLIETVNGSTLGDDPGRLAEVMRRRAKVPVRPVPKMTAGTPDLSGLWVLTNDPYPETARLQPAAAARRKVLTDDQRLMPHNRCLPGPPPLPGSAAPFIAKFVQTPALLVALFEDYPGFRQIFLDGRRHPAVWEPSWMGHSVGHWEKDVLVVDTVGFNDRSLIGGIGGGDFPHSEALHMVERYRRPEFGRMELSVTFEDSNALSSPYHENVTMNLAPQEELLEFVCENNKPEHIVR